MSVIAKRSPLSRLNTADLLVDLVATTLAPPDPEPAPAEPPLGEGPSLLRVRTDEDLDRGLRDYLGVTLPHKRCCAGHTTPWEAVHDAFFARSIVAVWKASRGFGGKSFTLSALAMAELLFLRADVNILGGSGEQSKRVLESIGKLWAHAHFPREWMASEEPSAQRQTTVWGNKIVALMASQASVRGPHPQRLRMDEVDEMKLSILNSALGQPMSKGGVSSHVVLSSTHQYPDGTMAQMLKRAAEEGWRVFEWCYRENLEPHGWLSLAEVERKRAVLTTAMWETEVELQEPSAEGRAFDTEKVEAAFVLDLELEPPVEGARYGTGGDWAKKKNNTVIATIRHDVTPARVVAIRVTNRRPWPDMVADLDAQAQRYPGPVVHDNTGLGQVVHDLIAVQADPFDMVGRQRAELLSEYVAAVEHGELLWPRDPNNRDLELAYSEHKYATREDLYKGSKDGSSKHHLPDTISAGALAWRACGGVMPASAGTEGDAATYPNLAAGIQRGRLSGYVRGTARQLPRFGRRGLPTDPDAEGDG